MWSSIEKNTFYTFLSATNATNATNKLEFRKQRILLKNKELDNLSQVLKSC